MKEINNKEFDNLFFKEITKNDREKLNLLAIKILIIYVECLKITELNVSFQS